MAMGKLTRSPRFISGVVGVETGTRPVGDVDARGNTDLGFDDFADKASGYNTHAHEHRVLLMEVSPNIKYC